MKTILILILSIGLCLKSIGQQEAKLVRVIDADTYQLLVDKQILTCRLANVDAPELKQDFGLQAKAFAEGVLSNYTLQVNFLKKDFYGRWIVEISANGHAVDSLLVSAGMAWHYAQYSNKLYLENIMQQAISEKIGLWSCGKEKVCPPWLYRTFNKRNKRSYCMGCAY